MAQATSISSSQLIKPGKGRFYGFIGASGTTGTLKAWDSLTAANRVLIDTTAAVTAPFNGKMEPVEFQAGLFITVGGTGTFTIIWD